MMSKMTSFAELVISLNLALAGISLGLKNYQVGEKSKKITFKCWVKVFSHTKKPVF
jgi:hypothetical protein